MHRASIYCTMWCTTSLESHLTIGIRGGSSNVSSLQGHLNTFIEWIIHRDLKSTYTFVCDTDNLWLAFITLTPTSPAKWKTRAAHWRLWSCTCNGSSYEDCWVCIAWRGHSSMGGTWDDLRLTICKHSGRLFVWHSCLGTPRWFHSLQSIVCNHRGDLGSSASRRTTTEGITSHRHSLRGDGVLLGWRCVKTTNYETNPSTPRSECFSCFILSSSNCTKLLDTSLAISSR